MTTEYRLMKAEEMEQILDVWLEVYPETEREGWRREFLSIPGNQSHTFVAVENGRVLSTALLWVRVMNDSTGTARRIGNISHVATRPQARRGEHATRLLELAIEEMGREGCEFSTLFTSEEARPLYERLLWQVCPTHFWQGRLINVNFAVSDEYSIHSAHPSEEPSLWETLSDIYAEFNQNRPLAIRRDASTWKTFTAHKITDWVQAGASVWLAYPRESPNEICGYLVAHCAEQGFLVAEAGARERHRAAVAGLLGKVIGSYEKGQQIGGRLYLPNEPDVLALLESCMEPLVQVESDEMMVREIDPPKNGDFVVPASEGRGMFWLLDQI